MKTSGRWRHRLRWALLAVGLLVGVDLALRTELVERSFARLLEAGLEILSGERVLLGDLELSPVTQEVTINGLIVSHIGEDGRANPAVTVDAIRVRLGLPIDGAWIRSLEIDRPVVSLHIDEDGLREFRNARSSKKQSELPWDWIQLNNARLELDTPVGVLLLEGMDAETHHGDEVDISVQTARLMAGDIDEVARTVRAQRVRLSPNGVVVPHFRLESEHSSASGSLDAVFGGELRGELTGSVAFSVLNALVGAEKQFEGAGHLDLEFGGTVREPNATGVALIEGFQYVDSSRPEKPKTVVLERMVSPVWWSGRDLKVSQGKMNWAGGVVTVDAAVDLVAREVQVDAVLESADFRTALREVGGHKNAWTNFGADGEINLTGTVRPLDLKGNIELAVVDLEQLSGVPGGEATKTLVSIPNLRVDGGLEISSGGVWLTDTALEARGTKGVFDAYVGLSRTGPIDLRYDFERFDMNLLRPLNGIDLTGAGPLRGGAVGEFKKLKIYNSGRIHRFGIAGLYLADSIDLSANCNDFRTIEFPKFSGRLGTAKYRGDGEVTISANTQMDLNVEILEGRIGDLLKIGGGQLGWVDGRVAGMVTMVGSPSSPDGEIALDFRDVDLLGEPFPAGSVSGWWDKGDVRVDQLHLSRWNGAESVLVQGSIAKDWDSNLSVTATGFDLGRLEAFENAEIAAKGRLSVDAVVRGNLLEPKPKGRIALRDTAFAEHAVPDSSVRFEPTDGGIRVEGSVVGGGIAFEGVIPESPDRLFDVDATFDEFPLHTVFPIAADGSPVEARLTGDASFGGRWVDGQPIVDIEGRGKSLSVDWDRHRLHTLGPWEFASTGRSMSLSNFRIQGPGTDLEWGLESDDQGRLQGGGGGVVESDLARMVVQDLDRAEGPIGLNIGVGGTIQAPEWTVDAALCGVTLQGVWFPHPMEAMFGVVQMGRDNTAFRRLDFQGVDQDWLERVPVLQQHLHDLARRDGLHGRVGDGTISVTGGYASQEWIPNQYDIQAEVKDSRVQFIEELPPFKGDAALAFSGPANEALLSGTIDVNEMIFTDRITWEEWMLEFADDGTVEVNLDEKDAAFSMDIALRSDNTIEVRNNVGDLTAGGDLRIVGDTNQPGLVGSIVAVPGGRMHLKEREFELTRGEIHYVDPYSFDPELDLVLNTDVSSREDTYDVTYRVSGTLDDWRAETRSDPDLPSADVNALLLFGMTRAELERYGGLAGALAVEGGDLLASSFLFSSRDESDRGALFRIVEPFRPERLDLVSGVSERGSGLVNSELRLLYENELTDLGMDGGMMILEQNISRASDTYLGFEQRLARTLYARTYWGSEQVGRFLDVGGAYGVEMKVRWELD